MLNNIEIEIMEILADGLGIDECDILMSSRIKEDLGADSLDVAEMTMAIEDRFDLPTKYTNDLMQGVSTVGELAERVRGYLPC